MLKENILWIRPFATVSELGAALREFKRRYNEQWLIERHGFRTPSQVRAELTGSARGRSREPSSATSGYVHGRPRAHENAASLS
jgi:hypothetical protein